MSKIYDTNTRQVLALMAEVGLHEMSNDLVNTIHQLVNSLVMEETKPQVVAFAKAIDKVRLDVKLKRMNDGTNT